MNKTRYSKSDAVKELESLAGRVYYKRAEVEAAIKPLEV